MSLRPIQRRLQLETPIAVLAARPPDGHHAHAARARAVRLVRVRWAPRERCLEDDIRLLAPTTCTRQAALTVGLALASETAAALVGALAGRVGALLLQLLAPTSAPIPACFPAHAFTIGGNQVPIAPCRGVYSTGVKLSILT